MNIFTFDGIIGRDIEKIVAKNGKEFYKFPVANDCGFGEHKKTSWFNCTAFGKTGELIDRVFKKGDRITMSGQLTIERKDDSTFVNFMVTEFSFPKKSSKAKEETEQETFEEIEEDGDTPF